MIGRSHHAVRHRRGSDRLARWREDLHAVLRGDTQQLLHVDRLLVVHLEGLGARLLEVRDLLLRLERELLAGGELVARRETAEDPGRVRATAQWARRALPWSVAEQGEVNRAGLPGVLLQASGELGPAPDAVLSRPRFTALGRAALRTVTVIDEAGRGGDDAEVRPL